MGESEAKRLVRMIESMLNREIPGTPKIGGRVMYLPLPGTGSKARHVLSPRAQQVFSFLIKLGKPASSADLQKGLRVNRNVIAGAVHELKAKRALKRVQVGGRREAVEVAAEAPPRKRGRGRRKPPRGDQEK